MPWRSVTPVPGAAVSAAADRVLHVAFDTAETGFDPAQITLREVLEIFFAFHDPTTLDRQGADRFVLRVIDDGPGIPEAELAMLRLERGKDLRRGHRRQRDLPDHDLLPLHLAGLLEPVREVELARSVLARDVAGAELGRSRSSPYVVDDEVGFFYVDARGREVFISRDDLYSPPYSVSQATFSDTPARLPRSRRV